MGMDVYGLNPTNEKGEYFRASIWEWPAVYSVTVELCSDLLDEQTVLLMASNDGAGVKEDTTCKEMARRLANYMQQNPGGYSAYVEHEHTDAGKIEELLKIAGWDIEPPEPTSSRTVTHEHLHAWVEFLEHCGGFEVW